MSAPPNIDPLLPVSKAGVRTQTWAASRLRKHADYQRAYAVSRKLRSANLTAYLAPQTECADGPRAGMTVGKVLGKSHERNRIKRRIRACLRRHLDLLPRGFDLILHPRRSVLDMDFAKLEAEILRILSQAKVDAARSGSLQNRRPAAAQPKS